MEVSPEERGEGKERREALYTSAGQQDMRVAEKTEGLFKKAIGTQLERGRYETEDGGKSRGRVRTERSTRALMFLIKNQHESI